jgi:tRNA(Arg) A34 adenosine deaminase TadA
MWLKPTAMNDLEMMEAALAEARRAAAAGEAPVGAVIVDAAGKIIAAAGNAPVALHDPTAHAEILALREAARKLGNYRLAPGLSLYVTLEPCAMCAAAISHARIARLVYGAEDPKGGAVANGVRFFEAATCHWRPEITAGVRAGEAAALLKDFFRARRE